MQRCSRTHARSAPRARLARPGLVAAALPLMLAVFTSQAQASCQDLQGHLIERRNLVGSIQAMSAGGKKMDPKAACTAFGKLVTNGAETLKWAEANKEWCQVPDQFVEGMKADHSRVVKLRGQACGVASKQVEMEKKAREGGGLLGGGGLEGSYRIPQGAL